MAVSAEWQEFLLEQLASLGRVRARRMFGGVGLWLDETFFGLIAGAAGTVYFKVDEGNRAAYEAAGAAPFRPFADKAYAMSYWQVPAEVLDDADELVAWARAAVAAARRNRVAARRPRKKPAPSRPGKGPRRRPAGGG